MIVCQLQALQLSPLCGQAGPLIAPQTTLPPTDYCLGKGTGVIILRRHHFKLYLSGALTCVKHAHTRVRTGAPVRAGNQSRKRVRG